MYPASPPEAIDLLKKMLQFNPQQRITLDECLAHPFITAYSSREPATHTDQPIPQFSSHFESKPQPVSLDFDNQAVEPTHGRLFELILGEINHYKVLRQLAERKGQRRPKSVVLR